VKTNIVLDPAGCDARRRRESKHDYDDVEVIRALKPEILKHENIIHLLQAREQN
jgi:cell fate (sporulation/competence/biofilm development) regulator YlbF (YheA/YmcA/DUF963 family)